MRLQRLLIGIFALSMAACQPSNTSNTDTNQTGENANNDIPSIEDILKDKPLDMEPQALFDQSQLTSNAEALCVKFKALEGKDRTAVFKLLDPLLPNCPQETAADGSTLNNTDLAIQVMLKSDLLELLGTPNNLSEREDGLWLVYELTTDGSYQVLFKLEPDQRVTCRLFEAMM